IGRVLTEIQAPDAAISPSGKDFGFVHRKTTDADIYFVANTSNQQRDVQITFRSVGKPEIWDAMNGTAFAADAVQQTVDKTIIALKFEPYRSYVVVLSKNSSAPVRPPEPVTV